MILFFLRPLYYLLYHQFAWTYDFVAALVSLGRWQDWVLSVLPYLDGRVLEIGFGPGHLQKTSSEKNFPTFGLDESRQMAHQANRRICKQGLTPFLTRGYAQNIPFVDGSFDSVVATFPSEYIFELKTLQEIKRVLSPCGRLIILPRAWITGKRPLERLAAWLFRISGETPAKPGLMSCAVRDRFSQLGFSVHSEIVNLKTSQLLLILANKE